jgi:MFS family permease
MARSSGVCAVSFPRFSLRRFTLVCPTLPFHRLRHDSSGSQVILYFTGGSLSFIEEDLGITQGISWLPTANILAIAATCPYAGYLQDLFGKRYIALFGSVSICTGCALVGSAHTFGQALVGMALSGVGAAIGELTGLAG